MERNEGGKKLRRLMTTHSALVETFFFLHNVFICFPSDGTFCSSLIPFFSPSNAYTTPLFFVLLLDPSFLRSSLNGLYFFYTIENHNNQPILPFVLVHIRGKKGRLTGLYLQPQHSQNILACPHVHQTFHYFNLIGRASSILNSYPFFRRNLSSIPSKSSKIPYPIPHPSILSNLLTPEFPNPPPPPLPNPL